MKCEINADVSIRAQHLGSAAGFWSIIKDESDDRVGCQVMAQPGATVGDILRGEEWLRCAFDRDDGKVLSTVKEMNLDVHGSRRVHRRLWRSAG